MWVKPAIIVSAVSLLFSIFFAGRLAKEIRELGIVDMTRNIVSIRGLILYVKEKKKLGEPFSNNFYAAVVAVAMVFLPFVFLSIVY